MKLQKTDLARELLRSPRRDLPAGERMLLITVDGRRDLPQLRELARNLGLDPAVVESLYGRGLIAPVAAEATATTTPTSERGSPMAPMAAAAPGSSIGTIGRISEASKTRANFTPDDPAGRAARPPTGPGGAHEEARRALVAAQQAAEAQARRLLRAKVYALDLVARMLAGQDANLRALARHIDNEEGLLLWIEVAAQHLRERAGEARSERFRQRVLEELGVASATA